MIKVIKDEKETKKGIYPYIGVADGLYVLFNNQKSGTVLLDTSPNMYKTGYYSDVWAENDFEIFSGSITLEQ